MEEYLSPSLNLFQFQLHDLYLQTWIFFSSLLLHHLTCLYKWIFRNREYEPDSSPVFTLWGFPDIYRFILRFSFEYPSSNALWNSTWSEVIKFLLRATAFRHKSKNSCKTCLSLFLWRSESGVGECFKNFLQISMGPSFTAVSGKRISKKEEKLHANIDPWRRPWRDFGLIGVIFSSADILAFIFSTSSIEFSTGVTTICHF